MTKGFLLARPPLTEGSARETRHAGLNTRDASSSTIYQDDAALFAEYKRIRSRRWHAPRRKPVASSMSSGSVGSSRRFQMHPAKHDPPVKISPISGASRGNSFVCYNWFVRLSSDIYFTGTSTYNKKKHGCVGTTIL